MKYISNPLKFTLKTQIITSNKKPKMLLSLSFVCQASSSIAEINSQTNQVILKTTPSQDLDEQEMQTCLSQTNQTAIYTITIGDNVFRSGFVLYNSFKEVEIILSPDEGSSVKKSGLYYIASYEITFLENALDQQGVIGQLLLTIYNLNECIYNEAVRFETFKYIKPQFATNPNCVIIPTGIVKYVMKLKEINLLNETISKEKFNFSSLTLETADCSIGAEQYKQTCSIASQMASGSNFVSFHIGINIPKTIKAQNIYIDDYGISQNVSTTYDFILPFNLTITKRISVENCTTDDQLSFQQKSIYISQKRINSCDFSKHPKSQLWITASELADKSGESFQLQFYSDRYFEINQYVDCQTWEISGYTSIDNCGEALNKVSKFPRNMSSSIVYKVYDENNKYQGAYRFNALNIPGGQVELVLFNRQLCAQLLTKVESDRTFAGIIITLSSNFEKFQNGVIEFQIESNFIFPAVDDNYCFDITEQEQTILNEISFNEIFGIVKIIDSLLEIQQISPMLEYSSFWQGYVSLVLAIVITVCWVVVSSKFKKKEPKNRTKM